jgi:integrase
VGLVLQSAMPKITDAQIRNLPARSKQIADGSVTGLWYFPGSEKGKGKWIFKYTSKETRARREMGLGTYPEIKIDQARSLAQSARTMNANKIDPINHRNELAKNELNNSSRKTFEEAARVTYQEKLPGWSNGKHTKQWIATLEVYVFPIIGSRFVDTLKPTDFADCLRKIWTDIPETASRVRQRCFDVMKWCRAHELVDSNPVELVEHILGKQKSKSEREQHQPAMDWRQVPLFCQGTLHSGSDVSRRGLEFLILTAARSGEIRGAVWSEIDFTNKIWSIPEARMKKKKPHRIPLSKRAIEILKEQKERYPDEDLIFPSPRGKILSDSVFTTFLRNHKVQSSEPPRIATAHGFRSSFRDWASEHGYSRDLAERALAHVITNKTEKAYHRTDLLDERRSMMEVWSNYIVGKAATKKRTEKVN